jgi:GDP-L-fucose synthase
MNVLVLGSTGFIGTNLTNKLTGLNSRIFTGMPSEDTSPDITVFGAARSLGVDLTDYKQTKQLLIDSEPKIIFNLASHGGSLHYVKEMASSVINDNIQMTLNVYKAMVETGCTATVIQPFSNCSYPGGTQTQLEESWLSGPVHDSIFSFGNSKRTIYYISKCYLMQHNIKTINLLLPNTYGPGDSIDPNHTHALNGMIIRMLQAKKAGDTEFTVWGTGQPVREWCYVDDFTNALIRAYQLTSTTYGETALPLNIGQARGYSIGESAKLIKKAIGFEGEIIFDTSYTDGDAIKILGNKVISQWWPDFKFFDHEQGIINTAKYYEDKV